MKKLIALVAAALFSTSALATEVYFSPNGGAQEALIKEIDKAQFSLHVMTYQLTNERVAHAIMNAWMRGVTTKVIVDKSQRNAKCCVAKVAQLMPVKVDDRHPIQHNKVVVIDGTTVVTGSFNFSAAAERSNAENLLVIRDKDLAQQYVANWQEHAAHSGEFQ